MAAKSPKETSRFFAARARSTNYAATAKNLALQSNVKTGHSYKRSGDIALKDQVA